MGVRSRVGVAVYADEHVGLVPVRDVVPFHQFDEAVILTGVQYVHVRQVLLDVFTHQQGHRQGHVLLGGLIALGAQIARILATMAGIQDDGTDAIGIACRLLRHGMCGECQHKYTDEPPSNA